MIKEYADSVEKSPGSVDLLRYFISGDDKEIVVIAAVSVFRQHLNQFGPYSIKDSGFDIAAAKFRDNGRMMLAVNIIESSTERMA